MSNIDRGADMYAQGGLNPPAPKRNTPAPKRKTPRGLNAGAAMYAARYGTPEARAQAQAALDTWAEDEGTVLDYNTTE